MSATEGDSIGEAPKDYPWSKDSPLLAASRLGDMYTVEQLLAGALSLPMRPIERFEDIVRRINSTLGVPPTGEDPALPRRSSGKSGPP